MANNSREKGLVLETSKRYYRIPIESPRSAHGKYYNNNVSPKKKKNATRYSFLTPAEFHLASGKRKKSAKSIRRANAAIGANKTGVDINQSAAPLITGTGISEAPRRFLPVCRLSHRIRQLCN